LRGGYSIHRIVITAVKVRMVLVAGKQQKGMLVTFRIHSNAGNFAAIVDVLGMDQIERRAWGNQGIQVEDRVVLPEKSARSVTIVYAVVLRDGVADDLPPVVDRLGRAAWVITNGSQIDYLADLRPECGMEIDVTGNASETGSLSGIIDYECSRVTAAAKRSA